MKLAAIDVGSNGVRLLISNVFEVDKWKPILRKANLYRVPVRLGEDAFVRGEISPRIEADLLDVMRAFRLLMDVCHVDDYLACATSAMRTSTNGKKIAKRIRDEVGIDLQIISGAKEAEYIAMNGLGGHFANGDFLYIDVGGGSTELSLYRDGNPTVAKSFKIGTIRLKESLVSSRRWKKMERWVLANCRGNGNLRAIGSGGNIGKIFELTGKQPDQPLSLKRLNRICDSISQLSMEERMIRYGFRPDRADVIVPAGRIYSSVMEWAGIGEIFAPQIGLSTGLVYALYRRRKKAAGSVCEPSVRPSASGR